MLAFPTDVVSIKIAEAIFTNSYIAFYIQRRINVDALTQNDNPLHIMTRSI